MNKEKEMDLMRKRNRSLTRELEEAKDKYDQLRYLNSESTNKAKDLITELEAIKDEWYDTMTDLRKKRDECDKLVDSLKKLQKMMRESARKSVPWYIRFLNKFKK